MFARRPYTNPGSCILRDFRSAKVAVIKYRVVKMACHSHKDSARTLHLDRSRLRNASRASTERGARCNERLKKKDRSGAERSEQKAGYVPTLEQ